MKNFTVDEARAMLPILRQLITDANAELEKLSAILEEVNARYEAAEKKLDAFKSTGDDASEVAELRDCRLEFQAAIEQLSKAQKEYLTCLDGWVDRITGTGVILRDLRAGLLDFPARQENFDYYLCWKLSDTDIDFWHLQNDGFIGRRPLAVLAEYF
jgi:hypothetical protein